MRECGCGCLRCVLAACESGESWVMSCFVGRPPFPSFSLTLAPGAWRAGVVPGSCSLNFFSITLRIRSTRPPTPPRTRAGDSWVGEKTLRNGTTVHRGPLDTLSNGEKRGRMGRRAGSDVSSVQYSTSCSLLAFQRAPLNRSECSVWQRGRFLVGFLSCPGMHVVRFALRTQPGATPNYVGSGGG
jgi:hypothetical protein